MDTDKTDNKKYLKLTSEFEDFYGDEVSREYQFDKPSKTKIARAQKDAEKSMDKAGRNFCISIIHPDEKERFLQDIEEYPGLPGTFMDEIFKRMGFGSLGK